MPWRLYAAIVVLLLLVMVQRGPLMPGAGLNWEGAQAAYWSLAPIGLVGYAYGFRILSQTFWRVYALIFTADITIRAMAKVGWVPLARLLGFPEESRHGTFTIILGLGLIAATCLALLRYGGWLKAPARVSSTVRSSPIVETTSVVERSSTEDQPGRRYSFALCALASLAGAAISSVVRWTYLGELGLVFAPVEVLRAFMALVLGGRGLANRLAANGKDTMVRGAAMGAGLGTIVAAAVAILFAGALLGSSLLTSWTALWAAGLLGVPFGLVNGAATGLPLVLLGRLNRSARGKQH